jgi:hypothetical protein
VTEKQIPPKTEAEVQGRRCSSCDKPDTETGLLSIILPPVIMERQDLCGPCLKTAIDDSKKLGKSSTV